MGLFNFFSCKKHTETKINKPQQQTIKYPKIINLNALTTVDEILNLPLEPDRQTTSGWPVYYALQRKATEYKKSKNMEMAIACLRKSNEISDHAPRTLLLDKDYYRLPKYIKLTGNIALSEQEEYAINIRHPEFLNRGITSSKLIRDAMKRSGDFGNDLIIISSFSKCPYCSKYNKKIYSISGNHRLYPEVPVELIKTEGVCKQHVIGANVYFEGISDPIN